MHSPLRAVDFRIRDQELFKEPVRPLRVALINPPDPSSSSNSRLLPPLGLGYVAAYARECGHTVDLFDFALDIAPTEPFLRAVGLFDAYDVYGFSSYSDSFRGAERLARVVRTCQPDATIVFGGYHVSTLDVETLSDFSHIDVVVRGEGERIFAEVLARLSAGVSSLAEIPSVTWRAQSKVIRNPAAKDLVDQDQIPFPARDFKYTPGSYVDYFDWELGRERTAVSIVSSRGCPKRCTFCSIAVLDPLWRARSVASLMAEVRQLYSVKPFAHIFFEDANFFVRPTRTLEFALALQDFNPEITWSATSTPDHIVKHRDVIGKIGASNCVALEVGIESGNENSLKRFGKGNTLKTNREVMAILEGSGIRLALDFIMFEPLMSLADVSANLRFVEEMGFEAEWPSPLFQELQLYPGTAIRDEYFARRGEVPPSHDVPITKFDDPLVGMLFAAITEYQRHARHDVDKLIRKLYSLLRTVQRTRECQTESTLHLYVDGYKSVIELRHLPFAVVDNLTKLYETDSLSPAEPLFQYSLVEQQLIVPAVTRANASVAALVAAIERLGIPLIQDKYQQSRVV